MSTVRGRARKILISGGGRCNFTNLHTTAADFLSRNPHFAKSALARYTPGDFIALLERHAIPYHEKTLGQLFCDRGAADILNMLLRECAAAGVRIATQCTVTRIAPASPGFRVETPAGNWIARSLVIATGGLSIPKIGATPFGYKIARQFGLDIVECYPALVPFTFTHVDRQRFEGLAGVSTEVAAGAAPRFREMLLFTHRGLSGPAILQASSYWRAGCAVPIDLLPGEEFAAVLTAARANAARVEARTLLARYLPKRLADRWCELHADGSAAKPLAAWSDREIAGSPPLSTTGALCRPEPKATRRRKSPPAASIPPHFRPGPWSAAAFPASISSARWSMLPATWGASTSSGRGPPELPREGRSELAARAGRGGMERPAALRASPRIIQTKPGPGERSSRHPRREVWAAGV